MCQRTHLIPSFFKEPAQYRKSNEKLTLLGPPSLHPPRPRPDLAFSSWPLALQLTASTRSAERPVFCGHVKPGKCRADLLWERLLMSLPFCSLIAHHQGRCPSDPRSPTRRCPKCPQNLKEGHGQGFFYLRALIGRRPDRDTFLN